MYFYLPTKVITGKEVISKNAELFSGFGKRCIIVTGKNSAKACGALDDVTNALKKHNVEYTVFDKIMQNPEITCCAEGGALARKFGAEFIIGIGGGSPLDAAKAIAVFAVNDIDDDTLYSGKWDNSPLPVIAVGTTAGTGSEVTQVAVITDKNGKKKSFRHDKCFPALSLGDPKYLSHMPEKVFHSTAIDALSHCLESYFIVSSTEFSRAAAVQGIRKICCDFMQILDGKDPNLFLEDIYKASLYGGYAISVTGTAFPHALGYFLSEDHGIPHGTACGIYLPEFIKYNEIYAPDLSHALYKSICLENADALCDMINTLLPKYDITVSESEKDALMPRWVGHKCLAKMYGNADESLLDSIVRKLF